VRTMIRFALIVGVLLLLVGLGLYVYDMDEVHDWLRPLGRKHHAPDEVVVKQRTTAVLPGLDGTVKVRVGDIKRSKLADIEIIGPDSVTLATNKDAQVGDRIAFTHESKKYELEVIRYVDKLGSGDSATFRITPLPSDTKVTGPGGSNP